MVSNGIENTIHNLKSKIEELFHASKRPPDVPDISGFLDKCKQCLESNCSEGQPLDIANGEAARAVSGLYNFISYEWLEKNGYVSAAEVLLLYGWQLFNNRQQPERKIYRGTMGILLAYLYLRKNDPGASMYWALRTQVDDGLDDHLNGGAAQMLRNTWGMSEVALNILNEITKEQKEKIDNNWSRPCGFADDGLLEFLLRYPEHSGLFTQDTGQVEFQPTYTYLKTLIHEVKNTLGTNEKGAALEKLAAYLFMLIPGHIPQRNTQDNKQTFESDLVVHNQKSGSSLEVELFGRSFLVECKNWENTVGSNQLGYFLYRMHVTHTKFGVMFARNGIAGNLDDDSKFAENLRRMAYQRDGSTCIVITLNDLEQIKEGETTFRTLLITKTNELRFGKSRY